MFCAVPGLLFICTYPKLVKSSRAKRGRRFKTRGNAVEETYPDCLLLKIQTENLIFWPPIAVCLLQQHTENSVSISELGSEQYKKVIS